jgi:hypothetical protein
MWEGRFTVDGDALLEKSICEDLSHIAEVVRALPGGQKIKALALGGGYGRGEGGVVLREGHQTIYNDYDLFVVTSGTTKAERRELNRELECCSKTLTDSVGVDVDFSSCLEESQLKKLPFQLMWLELRWGHFVFFGPSETLLQIPEFQQNSIPMREAERLLINRGMGVLLASQRLNGTLLSEEDREFIIRNLRKADLAIGDALLMSQGLYRVSYRERQLLVSQEDFSVAPRSIELFKAYRSALEFKFHPDHVPYQAESLKDDLRATVARYRVFVRWFLNEASKCARTRSWKSMELLLQNLKKNVQLLLEFGPQNPRMLASPYRDFLSTLPSLHTRPSDGERVELAMRMWPFVG